MCWMHSDQVHANVGYCRSLNLILFELTKRIDKWKVISIMSFLCSEISESNIFVIIWLILRAKNKSEISKRGKRINVVLSVILPWVANFNVVFLFTEFAIFENKERLVWSHTAQVELFRLWNFISTFYFIF